MGDGGETSSGVGGGTPKTFHASRKTRNCDRPVVNALPAIVVQISPSPLCKILTTPLTLTLTQECDCYLDLRSQIKVVKLPIQPQITYPAPEYVLVVIYVHCPALRLLLLFNNLRSCSMQIEEYIYISYILLDVYTTYLHD